MEHKHNASELAGKKKDYLLPASILIAALLVSVSVIYNAGRKSPTSPGTADLSAAAGGGEQASPLENLKPVTSEDHIFGNPDAPIKIVEFSDIECPFCKDFHLTLKQVVSFYGGKVAWVYRHFPLDQLHSKARKEAEATECAAELGGPPGSETGNEKFWAYTDRLMEITPSNDGLDLAKLPEIAAYIGLDRAAFESCLKSGKHAEKIESYLQDGVKSGGRGTPYSIVVSENGKKYVIPGALPFTNPDPNGPSVKAIIDKAIKEL